MEIHVLDSEVKARALLAVPPIPQVEYDRRIVAFKQQHGCAPRIPQFSKIWEAIAEDTQHLLDPDYQTSYYKSLIVILTNSRGNAWPLLFVRDEQIHDSHVVIPVTYLDEYGVDNYNMWSVDWSDQDLAEFGLQRVPHGLLNPLVDLNNIAALRRFRRHFVPEHVVDVLTSREEIERKLEYYTPLALQYWESQGIYACISNDLYMLDGGGMDSFLGIEVQQPDGSCGFGLFTEPRPGELYWDFSRRSPGNNIGNNILYAACLEGAQRGMHTLNLGVGYYKWKQNWSRGNNRWNPGLRFIGDPFGDTTHPLHHTIGQAFATRKLLTTGFNKERSVP